jgi:4-amino-4-deoxy-L-arabinose transferase-like glycosyltransferase
VLLVFLLALAAIAPTVGDFGLTYDEPAYRYSQLVSVQWWEHLVRARERAGRAALFTPDALLYYWPYGRYGINFHPPLAGQLNLLTWELFGGLMKDIPARRMASAIELALTATLLFAFIGRRYGCWAGLASATALVLMPRVYGQAHLIDTDTPGLLLWVAAVVAFWKGLYEDGARRWRVALGVLIGLAFVEKMAAVAVLLPILGWLVASRLWPALHRPRLADWIDGLLTTGAMLTPLLIAFGEILRLSGDRHLLPLPQHTDLFVHRPNSPVPGAVLLVPLAVWIIRRFLGRWCRASTLLGAERPALETWTAILAFAPAVGWLGNPAWWRETMPRLAHYYMLNTAREGVLPDIRILYRGDTYLFCLPPSNGWVLIGVTVPVTLLLAAGIGLIVAARRTMRRDWLSAFVVLNLVTIPLLRMLPTPAHDGVRLMLPTFAFLAILAGWGIAAIGDAIAGFARTTRPDRDVTIHLLVGVAFLPPAAWQLIRVHPYELSYYNEWIGGPRGAWRRGYELSYWYDAFTPEALRAINARLPRNAEITFPNKLSEPVMVVQDLQSLGALRNDLILAWVDLRAFPYYWLLTHDSKADPFTRLLFQMTPWFASQPIQLDGARVATVADPLAISRAWALHLLATGGVDLTSRSAASHRAPRPRVNQAMLQWAKEEPDALLAAARTIAENRPLDDNASRLSAILQRSRERYNLLLNIRPEALVEAVQMLIRHPEQVRAALLRESFTDPALLGGYLDRDLPAVPDGARSISRRPRDPARVGHQAPQVVHVGDVVAGLVGVDAEVGDLAGVEARRGGCGGCRADDAGLPGGGTGQGLREGDQRVSCSSLPSDRLRPSCCCTSSGVRESRRACRDKSPTANRDDGLTGGLEQSVGWVAWLLGGQGRASFSGNHWNLESS